MLAELLLVFRSDVVLLTVAVFEIVPPGRAMTSTLSVIVADPPALIVPSEQFRGGLVPPKAGAVHDPWLVVNDENVAPDGIGSLTLTSDAGLDPVLLTVIE